MLVVDASVAVRWFIPDAWTERALSYVDGDQPLIAPSLLFVEVANAMWNLVSARRIDMEFAQSALRDLPDFFDEVVADEPLLPQALLIAEALGHPVYDCVYLALARQRGVRFLTADNRLITRIATSKQDHDCEALIPLEAKRPGGA